MPPELRANSASLTSMALHAAKPLLLLLLLLPHQLEQIMCLLDGTQTSPQVRAFAQRYADSSPTHAVDAVTKELSESRR